MYGSRNKVYEDRHLSRIPMLSHANMLLLLIKFLFIHLGKKGGMLKRRKHVKAVRGFSLEAVHCCFTLAGMKYDKLKAF